MKVLFRIWHFINAIATLFMALCYIEGRVIWGNQLVFVLAFSVALAVVLHFVWWTDYGYQHEQEQDKEKIERSNECLNAYFAEMQRMDRHE